MKKIKTAKQILRAAKRLLVDKGWTKGELKAHGRYCSMGAFRMAATGNPNGGVMGYPDALKALHILKNAIYAAGGGEITGWNDQSNRTKKEVLKVFDTAIGQA